ncbi:MAG: right-handed parallel beta-helix repeat-containing protein [bacterium]
MIIYGTLNATGSVSNRIIFTSLKDETNGHGTSSIAQAGDWRGIKFRGNESKGTISYCLIRYAKQGIYLQDTTKGIMIIDSIIHNNKGDNGIGEYPGENGAGIYLTSSSNNFILHNTIYNNSGGKGGDSGSPYHIGREGGVGAGIYLYLSANNTIKNNKISDNKGGKGGNGGGEASGGRGGIGAGIYLYSSVNNILLNNIISKSNGGIGGPSRGADGVGYGIYIDSNSLSNTIGPTNTYNNEPIHYYYNMSGIIIKNQILTGSPTTNIGKIVLISCNNFTIKNNTISDSIGLSGHTGHNIGGEMTSGIYLFLSDNNKILDNKILNNIGGRGGAGGYYNLGGTGGIGAGIYLYSSNGNIIGSNTLSNNRGGDGGDTGYDGSGMYHGGWGGIGMGIYLYSSTNNIIIDNDILNNIGGDGGDVTGGTPGGGGNGVGIYLLSSPNNDVVHNTIIDNKGGSGISPSPDGSGIGVYCHSSLINIIRNNIYNNSSYNLSTNISTGTQNAEYNWWGQDPPATFTFYGIIDYEPWLIAPSGNGKITLIFPNSGCVGDIITLQGNGYAIKETIQIDFGTTNSIAITLTDESGVFTVTFTVDTQCYGGKKVSVIGITSKIIDTRSFFLKAQITLVTPTSGIIGSWITVKGNGVGSKEAVWAYLNEDVMDGKYSLDTGEFVIPFYISSRPGGSKTITIKGYNTGANATSSFFIKPNLLLFTPMSGSVGSKVTISSNGFGAVESVKVLFGITPTITVVTTNAFGVFTAYFTVDTQPYGNTTISAFGLTSQIVAWNTFLIYQNIILVTPTSGTVGSFVSIGGNGFGSSEGIQIDFGSTANITQISSTAKGTFSTIFTVDTQPYGITTIAATGINSNARAYATFKILPKILFVVPYEGTVGTMVTIRGSGFGANELICINFGTTPTIQTTSTYAEGSFTTTFTIDTQSYGTTTIKVIGVNTQAEIMVYFFILPSIIFVSPCDGTVGSLVTIAGNGFGKLEAICVDFGTTLNVCMVSSTMYGSFSAVFTVDTQPYGTTTLAVSGFVSGTRVFWYGFMIVPKITQVLPSSGQVGTLVTIAGNGFGATELIRIDFGTTHTITLASTNGTGEFQTVFTVDSQPIGTTTISAYGMQTNSSAKSLFIMLPLTTLKITPSLQNIAAGTEFTSQVEIKDVRRMITAKLHLSFNPNILEVQEIGTGTFPQDGMVVKQYDNTTGEIDYFVGLLTGSATGSGVICTLKFKAKAGGTSAVVFDFDDPNRLTRLKDADKENIPFNKEEALYRVIIGIDIRPKDKVIKADESIDYQCIAYCGDLELDITGSTTFTATGGGDFTLNTFLAKYMGTYTIQGSYLGFIGTTSVIITPGTPTTLLYISGNNQVNTCTLTLKEPFIVKVVDKYENPCQDVEVNWEIISTPSGATLYSISPTKTTTNVQGTTTSLLTLGTEPPGTYTIHAISTGLQNSPYIFTAHSLRRFGNIAGFCMLDFGTELGTSSQIQVTIVESGKTTTTNENSYFIFENVPIGTYTLNFDTHGASSKELSGVCISKTQFEDTTYIGTVSLLAGDVNNDGKINIDDWPVFVDSFFKQEGDPGWNEAKNADFNHDGQVDDEDFIIFRDNFGKGKAAKHKARKITPVSSSGRIELSFNIETLEGVDIDNLRIGNIIYLKVYIRDAKDFLGGEVHLSFNSKLLEVVDAISENTYKNTTLSAKVLTEGIQIQPGDYVPQDKIYPLINKVDNEKGKIDYAIGVMEPMDKDEGVLAIVPFRIKACGGYSKVGFEFNEEENRQTMFIERTDGDDQIPEVSPDEVIINVPHVFNDLNNVLVYPNPAYKGQEVIFDQLTTDKQITLRIYSLAGELVFENSGMNKIKWPLKNKDNEYVASGIYIYFLKDELGSVKKGKIGVIK